MTKTPIISIILIILAVIIYFAMSLNTASNSGVSVFAILLPGILIAIITGLIIALITFLFSKNRSRKRFCLTFSIIFSLTILIISFGTFENQKDFNISNQQKITSNEPYISSKNNFQINFPTKPEIGSNDYSDYGINGNITVYISTKEIDNKEIIYYLLINDMKTSKLIDKNEQKNYYEQFPIIGLAEAGAKITKIFSRLGTVYKNYDGVEYKYKLEADKELFYKRGTDFIIDEKSFQISIIYSAEIDNQIEDIYTNYFSSFVLD